MVRPRSEGLFSAAVREGHLHLLDGTQAPRLPAHGGQRRTGREELLGRSVRMVGRANWHDAVCPVATVLLPLGGSESVGGGRPHRLLPHLLRSVGLPARVAVSESSSCSPSNSARKRTPAVLASGTHPHEPIRSATGGCGCLARSSPTIYDSPQGRKTGE